MDFENRITLRVCFDGGCGGGNLAAPESAGGVYRPGKGQGEPVDLYAVAKLRGEALDHVLLYGPPGLGKTTLAGIVANEMGVNLRVTSGPAIEKPGDLAALLTNLSQGDILFIDEIHRLSRSGGRNSLPGDGGLCAGHHHRKRSVGALHPNRPAQIHPDWSDHPAGQMTSPLRDRFGALLRLELYQPQELCQITPAAQRF